jgi:integrase
MVRAGVSLYEIQRILGHSTPLMTQRYAALAPDDLRRAVAVLGRALGEAARPAGPGERGG